MYIHSIYCVYIQYIYIFFSLVWPVTHKSIINLLIINRSQDKFKVQHESHEFEAEWLNVFFTAIPPRSCR